MPNATAPPEQHAEEIKRSGPDDGEVGGHRVRVDYGGNRIRGVVESIDEFKSQGDQ
jgi:hypothetical protein